MGITERPLEKELGWLSVLWKEAYLVLSIHNAFQRPRMAEHPSACSYRPLAEVTEHPLESIALNILSMVPVSLRLLFPKIESYLLSAGYPEGSLRCLGLL